jgi:hypothetical protein
LGYATLSPARTEHPLLPARRRAGEEHLRGMDVPLGDRPLRVARLELHVGLRVARSGLVSERRMAEVVPGAEGLRDRGAAEGRPHVVAGLLMGETPRKVTPLSVIGTQA